MDHVRGSSLASSAVMDTLRPFILSWWSGRSIADLPADWQPIFEAAGFRGLHMNLGLVLLNPKGEVVRSYLPRVQPPAFGFDPDAQGRDFQWQLGDMLQGLEIPRPTPAGQPGSERRSAPKLALPDVTGPGRPAGVRIFLTFSRNHMNHYRTPTVEVVSLTDSLKKALRLPAATGRTTDAAELRPILEQLYPPAVMDGFGKVELLAGRLTWKTGTESQRAPAALLKGKVGFRLDNASRTAYEGDLTLALRYDPKSQALRTLRGIMTADFPKGPEWIRMTATLESRPD